MSIEILDGTNYQNGPTPPKFSTTLIQTIYGFMGSPVHGVSGPFSPFDSDADLVAVVNAAWNAGVRYFAMDVEAVYGADPDFFHSVARLCARVKEIKPGAKVGNFAFPRNAPTLSEEQIKGENNNAQWVMDNLDIALPAAYAFWDFSKEDGFRKWSEFLRFCISESARCMPGKECLPFIGTVYSDYGQMDSPPASGDLPFPYMSNQVAECELLGIGKVVVWSGDTLYWFPNAVTAKWYRDFQIGGYFSTPDYTDGLLIHYSMERTTINGAILGDRSGNGNNGTLTGSPVLLADRLLHIPQDSYVVVPNLTGLNDFSITFKAKMLTTGTIFSTDDDPDSPRTALVMFHSSQVMEINGVGPGFGFSWPNEDQEHSFALVRVGTDIKLYIDGVSQYGSPVVVDGGVANFENVRLSIYTNNQGSAFPATTEYSEFRVYNKELSLEEISGLPYATQNEPFLAGQLAPILVDKTSISLETSPSSGGPEGTIRQYIIQRSDDGETFTNISGGSTASDLELDPETEYYYRAIYKSTFGDYLVGPTIKVKTEPDIDYDYPRFAEAKAKTFIKPKAKKGWI